MKSVSLFSLLTAIASTFVITTTATASNLVRVTIENIAQNGGPVATPFWLGFHEGNWNTFDPMTTASTGIEHLAEDGYTGLENQLPGFENFNFGVIPIPINNTISRLFANSTNGVQKILSSDNNPILGLFPGQANSVIVDLGNQPTQRRFFSYASMFFPSNDGFFADLEPLEIIDSNGKFIGADFVISGSDVWDAGTEVNDENFNNIPFMLPQIAQGISENGIILPHPGLLPPGSGGILPFPPFFDGNASITPDLQIVRITIEQVPEPSTIISLLTLGGLGILSRVTRLRR